MVACVVLPVVIGSVADATHVRIVVTAVSIAVAAIALLVHWAGVDSRRRRTMFKLLLVAPTVLLALEALYAWVDWREAKLTAPLRAGGGPERSGMVEKGEPCGYHLIPSRTYEIFGGLVRINAQGFRHPEDVALDKVPGVRRVMLVGGSTAFSWNVPDGEDLAACLRHELAPADRWEIINAAVPYYTSYQELCDYRERLHQFSPDAIVVFDGRNDVRYAIMQGHKWRPATEGGVGELPFVEDMSWVRTLSTDPAMSSPLMRSAIYRRIYALVAEPYAPPLPRRADVVSTRPVYSADHVDPRFITQLIDHHRRIAESVTEDGGVCILALQPVIHLGKTLTPQEEEVSRMWDDLGDPFRLVWPRVQAAVAAAEGPGIRVDLTDVFADFAGQAYLDECHYTPAGNRRIAEALAEAIRDAVAAGM